MKGTRRAWFASAAAALWLVSAGAAWAQEPGFLPALLEQLGRHGWTVQERNAFAEAAAGVDWTQVENADPEAVALALSLRTREQLQVRDRLMLTEREQVEAALQLALMAREMAAAGFDRHDTAAAAAAAMRNCLGDIHAWMEGGRHGELGQIIRTQVRAAMRSQVGLAARWQGAGVWSGDRNGQANGAGAGVGGGMQGAGGGTQSGYTGGR
jgi:hypothetical protein